MSGTDYRLGPGITVPAGSMRFSFSSSPGPGGQNVNKRATKAELRVNPGAIPLDDRAMERLLRLAAARLSGEGEIVITSSEHRSQGRNREACVARLRELVARALVRPRPRRATAPTRSSVRTRLEEKRRRGAAKKGRAAPGGEE